jgi:tetratricopeptide (TPR) repeat protein
MKKLIVALFIGMGIVAESQNIQVQNMSNYLRNKDFEKAKASADAASEHESTKGSAKTWMFRAKVYRAIAADSALKNIDPMATEKALEAALTCLKLDKGKDIYKNDVQEDFEWSAFYARNKALTYRINKQYDKANAIYDLLDQAIPLDPRGNLMKNQITAENMTYERFHLYREAGETAKQKEMAEKLIAGNFKDPKLYTTMVKMSLEQKDTAAALKYIEKGKAVYPENMLLVGTEIDIYLARKNTQVLKDKLAAAIAIDPKNDVLYTVLGQVYEKDNDLVNAEKYYLKAMEVKPESEVNNYNLGKLYFNSATEYNKKLNDLKPSETVKTKEYEGKVKENFTKAVPYLEKAFSINPDPAYKQRLRQIHLRLGETEKAAQYK